MKTDLDLKELAIDRDSATNSVLRVRAHLLTRYVLPLTLVIGFLGLTFWSLRDRLIPPAAVTVTPVFSTRATVTSSAAPLFKAAGWIEPRPTPVRVAALAPGVVAQLLVVEDQVVKSGQPIAELVKDDAILQYRRTQADLELRQAELEETQAALTASEIRLQKPVHLEAALGQSQAALAQMQIQLTNLPFEIVRAEANYKAMKRDYEGKLAAKGVVAGVTIDLARSRYTSAEALLDELQDRLESLRKGASGLTQRRDALRTELELLTDETRQRDASKAQVRAALARLEQAHVAVADAKLQLDRMSIVSPINGRVFQLIAHPGSRIGSGSGMAQMAGHDGSTVVTLYRPDQLQVGIDVRFDNIPQVYLNQPVEIINPALSSPITGKVLFISSEADRQKNTLQVKVDIPDEHPVFKPEMLVDVTFLAASQSDQKTDGAAARTLFIPQSYLYRNGNEHFVWIADRTHSIARKTTVQVGLASFSDLVEITHGLNLSSRIITSSPDYLRDGQRIRITDERVPTALKDPLLEASKQSESDTPSEKDTP